MRWSIAARNALEAREKPLASGAGADRRSGRVVDGMAVTQQMQALSTQFAADSREAGKPWRQESDEVNFCAGEGS